MVQNGERLELLDRDRRFLKVKTEKGEIGWIEEHSVVNPEVVSGFDQLKKAQERDPVVATGVLRDDGYLHLKPGRDTDRYYLLPEDDKLQLLLRASVPKSVGPQASGSASFASVHAGLREEGSGEGPCGARKSGGGERWLTRIPRPSASTLLLLRRRLSGWRTRTRLAGRWGGESRLRLPKRLLHRQPWRTGGWSVTARGEWAG